VIAAIALAFGVSAATQTNAYDDAFPYDKQTWITNSLNSGFGFTQWTLATSGSQFSGFFTTHDLATSPYPTIVSPTNASLDNHQHIWGLYGNGSGSTNIAVAYRGFSNALTAGVTFMLQWQNDGVTGGNGTSINGVSTGGFALRNGNATSGTDQLTNGQRFSFYQIAGDSNAFSYSDGNGPHLIGIPYTAAGLSCEFALETNDTYRFAVRNATNGAVLAFVDHQPLAGVSGAPLDSVALFAIQTGANQEFNRMQVVSNTLVPPLIVNTLPTNGSIFVNSGTNVSFEVDSFAQILFATNITLLLNDVAQTLAFNTNGATQHLLATNTTPLAANVQYRASIIAVDAGGNTATNSFSFNTLQTNSLWRDVKSFGATGNGVTMDTASIQSAISACPSGGFVWLHNGTFLSGTITLKNNMTLFIDPTATLLGSGAASDYPTQSPPLTNSQTSNCQRALVYAQSCSNITITGGGIIYGNGRTNFTSGVESTRPISIWTALCNQVNIQNVYIVDAAMWTVVNMQSDFLTISNININDDGLNGNRDGCDVVDCWHVGIANCTIDSGDDSICLKSGNSRGVNDLLVTNCTITRSQSNGLKLGTASTGPFTNILFQNCTVLNTSHSAMAIESVDGGAISSVTFQGINFASCQNAIFIILGSRSGAAVGGVNGITFRNITGSGMTDTRGCPVSGCHTNGVTHRLSNIIFDNVNISYAGGLNSIPGGPPEYAGQYPENTIWGNLPAYGYYIRHATNVTFTNCLTSATSADARPWIATSDVSNLKILGPTLNSWSDIGQLILQWNRGFTLQAAASAAGPFADLVGAASPYTNSFTNWPQRFFRLRQ
jgi:polygalacturonase